MGKKSRKNKTGKPTVQLGAAGAAGGSANVNATGEALTLLLLPPTGCCHGSKIVDFKNPDYIQAVQAEIRKQCETRRILQAGQDNKFIDCTLLSQKFDEDHKYLTSYDTNFCDFIFGFCAHLYLKGTHSASMEFKGLLELGIRMRYMQQPLRRGIDVGPDSVGYTKWNKYSTDISSKRGIINCLARETPCDCMKPEKLEAKKMDKNGVCHGCLDEVPKNTLKLCTGCNIAKYCSRECQVNEWPEHRELCKITSQLYKNCDRGYVK